MLRITQKKKENGFTLIECVIAMVVSLIGLLAIFTLIFTSVRIQILSKDMSLANSFAREKIEELKNSSRTAGGDVATNVNGYFDTPAPKFIRRWRITTDAMGTQTVAVRVVPTVQDALIPDANLVTRME